MPLLPPKEPTREDKLFGDLRRAVPKPHEREKHRNAWISDETWKLSDKRVSARRGTRVRARLRRLGQAFRASLKGGTGDGGWRMRGRMWRQYWEKIPQTRKRRGGG